MPLSGQSRILPRYLKARLRILRRPSVWVTASIPVVAIALAVSYWVRPTRSNLHPEQTITQKSVQPSPGGTAPSAVDGSTSDRFDPNDVDIDSLPVLGALGNLTQDPLPNGMRSPQSTSAPSSRPPDALSSFNASPLPSDASPFSSRNPFSLGSQSDLPFLPPPRVGQSASSVDEGMRSPTPPSTDGSQSPATVLPISPLESALQRSAVPTATPSLTRAATGMIPMPQPLPGQAAATPYLPQTSPPPGTTGYILPTGLPSRTVPTPAAVGQSSFQVPTSTRLPQTAPFSSGDRSGSLSQSYGSQSSPQFPNSNFYNAPSAQPSNLPEPESAPFSASGGSVGNGQINTFSNP